MAKIKRRTVIIDFKVWYTIGQYAELKGQSYQTIYAWVKRGVIEYKVYPELNDVILVKKDSESARPYNLKK
jgi:hypothetical protein